MDTLRPLASFRIALLLASAALAGAACRGGAASSRVVCVPPCPAGSTCTSDGCVPDEAVAIDRGVADDLGLDCNPPCAGLTAHCHMGQCVPCLVDEHCPAGSVCRLAGTAAVCVPGCSDDQRCAGMGGGAMRCCGGQCVDSSSDAANCGACGTTCMPAHAGAACVDGQCAAGACREGWADCNHDPADGCEVNTAVDVKNCGACGATCSIKNAIAACGHGCYVGACFFGSDNCNGDDADGCETNVLADLRNCGGCGVACPNAPHARSICINASCALSSCDQGFADCDRSALNGCETNTLSDANNCGRCGNACGQGLVCRNFGCTCPQCNFANASSKCVNNVCTLEQCVAGWGDCNMDPKDGCESQLLFDTKNCGACNNVCDMNNPYCTDGKCTQINNSALLIYASTYHADVKRVIDATGAFKAVDEFDASAGTPTVQKMLPYGAVLVYSDSRFSDANGLGNNLADYWDQGGSVVIATFANVVGIEVQGRFGNVGNGYLLITPQNQEQPNDTLGVVNEQNSPLMKDVMKFSATSAYRSPGLVINGGIVVAQWQSGRPLVVRGVVKGRNMVELNFYPPTTGVRQDFINGDAGPLLRNALLYR